MLSVSEAALRVVRHATRDGSPFALSELTINPEKAAGAAAAFLRSRTRTGDLLTEPTRLCGLQSGAACGLSFVVAAGSVLRSLGFAN